MSVTKETRLSKDEILRKVNNIVYSNTTRFGGSISAEHGIGQLRKADLKKYKSKFELEQMKSIKKIFDPLGIFNPVFNADGTVHKCNKRAKLRELAEKHKNQSNKCCLI